MKNYILTIISSAITFAIIYIPTTLRIGVLTRGFWISLPLCTIVTSLFF